MSKNACRMLGMIMMILSVFFIAAGLYLPKAGIDSLITTICLVVGIVLLIIGTVFYKILKTE